MMASKISNCSSPIVALQRRSSYVHEVLFEKSIVLHSEQVKKEFRKVEQAEAH